MRSGQNFGSISTSYQGKKSNRSRHPHHLEKLILSVENICKATEAKLSLAIDSLTSMAERNEIKWPPHKWENQTNLERSHKKPEMKTRRRPLTTISTLCGLWTGFWIQFWNRRSYIWKLDELWALSSELEQLDNNLIRESHRPSSRPNSGGNLFESADN